MPGAVVAVGLVVFIVGAYVLVLRPGGPPQLPAAVYRVSTWWRAMKWTMLLMLVALIAAGVASSDDAKTIVILGGVGALYVEMMFLFYAKRYGSR